MRTRNKLWIALAAVAAAGAAASKPAYDYWQARSRPQFRLVKVEQGDIIAVVNSTGTVKPVLSVKVGAVVSGPIEKIYVDFNDEVEKDQPLADIDPALYESAVARDQASLASRQAEVKRVESQLQQAKNDEARAEALRTDNPEFISQSELDKLKFSRLAAEAELTVARTAVAQADANLLTSRANLRYTKILSPVKGVVIERKIDQGQSLASAFQTPELFTIAPELEQKVHIYASVDEADIGLIIAAQKRNEPVTFNVDAYPEESFTGRIEQVRMSSTTTQNVVTYPVVVAAPNPGMRLLPGMTASISFQTDRRSSVLKIPNAALRYYPDEKLVREEDKKLLQSAGDGRTTSRSDAEETTLSAEEKAEAGQKRRRRLVWLPDGNKLRAVHVVTGLSSARFTELREGDLHEGDELVASQQQASGPKGGPP